MNAFWKVCVPLPATALANRISSRLLNDIVVGNIEKGQHVGAQLFADRYGVSRTPVREALEQLHQNGILVRKANRGYFVAEQLPEHASKRLDSGIDEDNSGYQQLANDWLTNVLPEEVTEHLLRQRYGWTKSQVADLLVRAAREGWAERKEGYGWRFLPVAKTPEAFDEIYRFRMAIEPVAMLEPSFEINRKILDEQRRIQENMLSIDMRDAAGEGLLNNGSLFHEEIIKMSGNPFFFMALQRVNKMRRLMEYRAEINRDRLIEQCTEHLQIVSLLERGEVVDASYLMRQHLSGALRRKSPLARNWAEAPNA